MNINKQLQNQNTIEKLNTLVSIIHTANQYLPSTKKHHYLSVLLWMLENATVAYETYATPSKRPFYYYSCIHGGRKRCIKRYNLTNKIYENAVKKLIASGIIKEIGKGGNGINIVYEIHPDIGSIYNSNQPVYNPDLYKSISNSKVLKLNIIQQV